MKNYFLWMYAVINLSILHADEDLSDDHSFLPISESLSEQSEQVVEGSSSEQMPIPVQTPPPSTGDQVANQKWWCEGPYRIYVGPLYTYARAWGHCLDDYRGNLWGLVGGFEYKAVWQFYGAFEITWGHGELKTGNPHFHREWDEKVVEADIGYEVSIYRDDIWALLPYTGVVYRHVNDQKGKTPFIDRIDLRYNTFFLPVGLLIDYKPTTLFHFGLNLKILPALISYLSIEHLNGVYWKMKKKAAYSIELPVTGKLWCFDVTAVPFWKYWRFGKVPALGLSQRSQSYFGVKAELGFSF